MNKLLLFIVFLLLSYGNCFAQYGIDGASFKLQTVTMRWVQGTYEDLWDAEVIPWTINVTVDRAKRTIIFTDIDAGMYNKKITDVDLKGGCCAYPNYVPDLTIPYRGMDKGQEIEIVFYGGEQSYHTQSPKLSVLLSWSANNSNLMSCDYKNDYRVWFYFTAKKIR
jgi:hypothetical protein